MYRFIDGPYCKLLLVGHSGMANCYVFKSLLQEYAQKVGFSTPVYHTDKEGPSHEPVFKSTVIVNDVTYESLPGFLNRKAAEQSAAEVALMELQKLGQETVSIPTVHETGLCKNLLQEYAQKMNYAIPSYICAKQQSGPNHFTCTVDIGGIQYIGAVAKTKKEAEIKAARTALLAIQRELANGTNGASQYTVLPGERKGKDKGAQTTPAQELKPKKKSFKKKKWSKKVRRTKADKEAKLNTDEPPSGTIVGEGESAAQVHDVEMSGRKEDEPQSQVIDSKPNEGEPRNQVNEIEPNDYSHDRGRDNSTVMREEISNRSSERNVVDIALLQQEVVKVVEAGSTPCLAG